MSGVDVCTTEQHEALKRNDETWLLFTVPIVGGNGAYGHDWRNCRRCNSTLLRPVAQQAVRS